MVGESGAWFGFPRRPVVVNTGAIQRGTGATFRQSKETGGAWLWARCMCVTADANRVASSRKGGPDALPGGKAGARNSERFPPLALVEDVLFHWWT